MDRAADLAQGFRAGPLDLLEQARNRQRTEQVNSDSTIAREADMPRPCRRRQLVEYRRHDGAFGESVEPSIGDDVHEPSRLCALIGEPDLAGGRVQRSESIQVSTSASTRLRSAR